MGIKAKQKKNLQKVKNAPKATLDSIFVQNPPQFSHKFDSKIRDMLESSLAHIFPSKENVPETPPKRKKIKLTDAATRNLSFGFNEVMRGLEKDQIKCVFLKALTKPKFLGQSFIHVCQLKSIPLVTVKGLSNIIKQKVGIKSTLALGFKSAACEEGSPFHDLYVTCCDTLDTEPLEDSESSETAVKSFKLLESSKSNKNIETYHLTLKDKSQRVFRPAKGHSLRIFHDPLALTSSYTETMHIDVLKNVLLPETSDTAITQNNVHLSDFMFIDDGRMCDDHSQETLDVERKENENLAKTSVGDDLFREPVSPNENRQDVFCNDQFKRKGKKRPANDFVYVETKIKRIKGNPNRCK